MDKAREIYFDARSKRRDPKDLGAEDNFLIESSKIHDYAVRSQAYHKTLVKGSKSSKPMDETVSKASRFRMLQEHFKIKSTVSVEDVLPRGVCLKDSLRIDQENTHTWQQPRLNKVSISDPMNHDVISLLNYDNCEFLLSKQRFDNACSYQQRNHLNTTISPCYVHTIRIPQDTYFDILKAKKEGKGSHTFTVPTQHAQLVDMPVGYTVSDGFSESLTIMFPIEKIPENITTPGLPESQTFKFTFTNLPREIVIFLKHQQMKVTDEAAVNEELMNSFVMEFFNLKCGFQFIDIASLAVAAGCRMDSLDLFSLASAIIGCPFPKGIDGMDQMWAWDSSDQPDLIFKYMCDKLVLLWELFQILIGCLTRNLFADPDLTLYALRMTEESFHSWFIYFVGRALLNTNPSASTRFYDANSRAKMLQSIKVGENHLLDKLADLYVNVPVVSCGGARFLHHVRHEFFDQFAVLEHIHLPTYLGDQPRPRDDLLDKRYELMYKREYVIDDSGCPVQGWDLQPSPQFAKTIYKLEIELLSEDDVLSMKNQHDREFIPAVSEWARLNSERIVSFFGLLQRLSCNELGDFWVAKIPCYDYMRSCVYRLTGKRLGVRALDLITAKREDRTKELLERSAGVNPSRSESARINMFDDLASGDNDDRIGLSQSVYGAIPGFNNKRNREWADDRAAKRQALRERDPNWMSDRAFKKSKQNRVLRDVEDQMYGSVRPSTSGLSPNDLRHRTSRDQFVSQGSKSDGRSVSSGSQTINCSPNDLRNRIPRIREPDYPSQHRSRY